MSREELVEYLTDIKSVRCIARWMRKYILEDLKGSQKACPRCLKGPSGGSVQTATFPVVVQIEDCSCVHAHVFVSTAT